MKREDIEKLLKDNGIAEDRVKAVTDHIVAENGKDVAAEVAKTTAKAGELEKANETITGLQDTIKKAGAEDIEGLKKSAKDWEDKYNTDIAAEQKKAGDIVKQYGLKDALKEKGAKDPEYLIYRHGGLEKFSFDGDGKVIGLDDVLAGYKESMPDQFSGGDDGSEDKSRVKASGDDHGSGGSGISDALLAGLREGAGLPGNKEE